MNINETENGALILEGFEPAQADKLQDELNRLRGELAATIANHNKKMRDLEDSYENDLVRVTEEAMATEDKAEAMLQEIHRLKTEASMLRVECEKTRWIAERAEAEAERLRRQTSRRRNTAATGLIAGLSLSFFFSLSLNILPSLACLALSAWIGAVGGWMK